MSVTDQTLSPLPEDEPRNHQTARSIQSKLAGRARHLTIALSMVVVFGAGVGVDRVVWDGSDDVGAQSSFTDQPEFRALQQTWDLIHEHYVALDTVEDRDLVYGAARGLLEALGDTGHSQFLDPGEADAFDRLSTGEFVGIGVELDFADNRPVVISPIDGSPADEAGIRPRDVILEINGQSTEGLSATQVSQLLRGDEATEVTLTLRHADASSSYMVTLTRRTIKIEPVSWSMLPDHVALIRLSEFSVGATDGVKNAIQAAKEEGAVALVLDLRDNPGGLVFEAVGVASQFMPEGSTLYLHKDRDDDSDPVSTVGEGVALDLPMTVLINNGSASAAEIVAAALRDNGRATLIGEKTYGTGTVLVPFELDDGSLAVIGTGLWLTPAGEEIWHVGVAPDVEIALPLDADPVRPGDDARLTSAELAATDDVQLQTAFEQVIGRLAAQP